MKPDRRFELIILVIILLVAALLRLAALDRIPPGLTHDEAGHGHDAIAILNGARPIYQTVGYGREPLYDYANAVAMSMLGATTLTLRLTSVFAGILLIPIVYLFVRRAFGVEAALATAALLAVSFWPLAVSRQALRSTLLPTLFTGAILVYHKFLSYSHTPIRSNILRRLVLPTILFGLLVAATLYTYIPARIMWLTFVVFLVYLAVLHRVDFQRLVVPTSAALLLAALLIWPMFDYLRANPDAEARLSMLDEPLQALQQGDLGVILNEATAAIAAWFVPGRGDDFLAYTIRGRAVFDPITFALFVSGLFLCVRNVRKPQYALILIWFGIGIAPSLITGNDASITRSISAMPVFYILPALSVVWLAARLKNARLTYAAFAALIVFTGVTSANDYFNVWGQSPDVRAAYQRTIVEIATSTRDWPNDVLVSSLYPLAPHDPYVAQVSLAADVIPFRWFDARTSLIFPVQAATLVVPASTPLDAYWRDLIGQPYTRISLRPDDLDPYFDMYAWDAAAAADTVLERIEPRQDNFGDALTLVGVDLLTPQIDVSGTIKLVTFWRVTDADNLAVYAEDTFVLFTHALDSSNEVVGQEDRLDAPAWSWRTGDLIAQIHRFALNTVPSSNTLSLEVGIYERSSGTRLSLIVAGAEVGSSTLVGTVEVRP